MPRLGRCWAEPRKRNGLWSLHFPELSGQALSLAASHFMLIHSHLGLCSSVCVRSTKNLEAVMVEPQGTGSENERFLRPAAEWPVCFPSTLGKAAAQVPHTVLGESAGEPRGFFFLRARKSSSENTCFLSQTFQRYFLSVCPTLVLGQKTGWETPPSPFLFHLYHPTAFPCWIFSKVVLHLCAFSLFSKVDSLNVKPNVTSL